MSWAQVGKKLDFIAKYTLFFVDSNLFYSFIYLYFIYFLDVHDLRQLNYSMGASLKQRVKYK